jgi:hypothetical protein
MPAWTGVMKPLMPTPLVVIALRLLFCSIILRLSFSFQPAGPPDKASMAACLGMCL